MSWLKNLFKSKEQLEQEFRDKLAEEENQKELLRKEVEQKILQEKRESNTPWFEPIIGAEECPYLHERYNWNQAFIKDLLKRGYTGESDSEVIQSYLDKQDQIERERIIEEEREKLRSSGEPWVEVVADEFDSEGRIAIKLDWNQAFIKYLRTNGFRGANDDVLVQTWLAALQRDAASTAGDYT